MLKITVKNVAIGLAVSLFSFSTIAMANDMKKENNNGNGNTKKMWMCETNASSSSNEADQKADDSMKKDYKSGKDAFSFAMQHCRDCTKITCSMENK